MVRCAPVEAWFGAQRAVERSSISISKMSTTITFHLQLYCSIYKHRILHRSATESNPEPPLVYRLASLASLGGSEKEALHEVQNTHPPTPMVLFNRQFFRFYRFICKLPTNIASTPSPSSTQLYFRLRIIRSLSLYPSPHTRVLYISLLIVPRTPYDCHHNYTYSKDVTHTYPYTYTHNHIS